MKNEKFYEDEVQEGSLIRAEISEEHSPQLSKLGKIYKARFNRPPSELKYARDIEYYKGEGVAGEGDALPRAKSLANRIADAFLTLKFIGMSERLEGYLEERGIRIELINDHVMEDNFNSDGWKEDEKRYKTVKNNWRDIFGTEVPEDNSELIKSLLLNGLEKQKIICELSDEIKIEKGEKVEQTCEIKKPNFVKTVNLKYKKGQGKNIEKDIEKIINDSNEKVDSISIL